MPVVPRWLRRALADQTQTAALEQVADFEAKPPDVILDVDETVLDDEWCNDRRATPIPGRRSSRGPR